MQHRHQEEHWRVAAVRNKVRDDLAGKHAAEATACGNQPSRFAYESRRIEFNNGCGKGDEPAHVCEGNDGCKDNGECTAGDKGTQGAEWNKRCGDQKGIAIGNSYRDAAPDERA
jgi:hypothetical protein